MFIKVLRVLAAVMLVICIAGLIFASAVSAPYDSSSFLIKKFTVKEGDSVGKIAGNLEQSQLIRNKTVFRLLVFMSGRSSSIKSGEYNLSQSMSPVYILRALLKGDRQQGRQQ